jgi:hypothetical protein
VRSVPLKFHDAWFLVRADNDTRRVDHAVAWLSGSSRALSTIMDVPKINHISNGCADIFLLRNLSGPLVHVLLILLEPDPYLYDQTPEGDGKGFPFSITVR